MKLVPYSISDINGKLIQNGTAFDRYQSREFD